LLKQRIITALILAPAAISAIFYLPLNYFAALLMAIVAIGAWEWGALMGFGTKIRRSISCYCYQYFNCAYLVCSFS